MTASLTNGTGGIDITGRKINPGPFLSCPINKFKLDLRVENIDKQGTIL